MRSNPQGFIQDLSFHGRLTSKICPWRKGGGEFLVAQLENAVAGFGALAPLDTMTGELCKLHVATECQGCGIGRLISKSLVDHAQARGFADVSLHVTATQSAAIALYRRLGFKETGRRIFTASVSGANTYFDTICMVLPLEGHRLFQLDSMANLSQ